MNHFCFALGALLLAVVPGVGFDYGTVTKKIGKEPKYNGQPEYALLLFGQKAEFKVWVVIDGELIYLDRNGDGDLTGADECFDDEKKIKDIELSVPGQKKKYIIGRILSDASLFAKDEHQKRRKDNLPQSMMVYATINSEIRFRQYCDIGALGKTPQDAGMSHFDGPLTIGPKTINWVIPEGAGLRQGATTTKLNAVVGTMDAKHKIWAVVESHQDKECAFGKGVRPVAEIEYPPLKAGEPVIRERYELDEFC